MRQARLIGRAFVAVVALGLCAVAAAAGVDHRGFPIRLGDRVDAVIDPENEADSFVFDAVEGTALSVVVKPAKKSGVVPKLDLVGPDDAELEPGATLKGNSLKVSKLELPLTGRYLLRVRSSGTGGDYQLKTKGKPPKGPRAKGVALAAGGTLDIVFGGDTGASLKATIKGDGDFGVTAMLAPDGGEIAGAPALFTKKKTTLKGSFDLGEGFGDYVVRLGGAAAAVTLKYSIKVKFPKVPKSRVRLGALEPWPADVDPDFGGLGSSVTVTGEGFVDGATVSFGPWTATETMFVSATELTATVPEGNGRVDLFVTNPDGQLNGLRNAITLIPSPPEITSVSPDEGPADGGTEVTVTGSHFTDVVEVALDGTDLAAAPVVVDDSTVRFTTPAHAPGAVDVRLTDGWNQKATAAGAFTFLPLPFYDPFAGTQSRLLAREADGDRSDEAAWTALSLDWAPADATAVMLGLVAEARGAKDADRSRVALAFRKTGDAAPSDDAIRLVSFSAVDRATQHDFVIVPLSAAKTIEYYYDLETTGEAGDEARFAVYLQGFLGDADGEFVTPFSNSLLARATGVDIAGMDAWNRLTPGGAPEDAVAVIVNLSCETDAASGSAYLNLRRVGDPEPAHSTLRQEGRGRHNRSMAIVPLDENGEIESYFSLSDAGVEAFVQGWLVRHEVWSPYDAAQEIFRIEDTDDLSGEGAWETITLADAPVGAKAVLLNLGGRARGEDVDLPDKLTEVTLTVRTPGRPAPEQVSLAVRAGLEGERLRGKSLVLVPLGMDRKVELRWTMDLRGTTPQARINASVQGYLTE